MAKNDDDAKTATAAAPATATATAPAEAGNVEGPIRDAIFKKLANLTAIKEIRSKYPKCSIRTAKKMLGEAELQKPGLFAKAGAAAGIPAGAIGDGKILDWLLDPANQARLKKFLEFIMEIIALIAPMFL